LHTKLAKLDTRKDKIIPKSLLSYHMDG